MDRVAFFNAVLGVEYPKIMVDFFDHFIALKRLVEDSGRITVLDSTENSISFSIDFINSDIRNNALASIGSLNGSINIYQRNIGINIKVLTDTSIEINLT